LDYARLVTVGDLRRYAKMHRGREVLPDLVKQLVYASCAVRECRIPGRDDTNQAGLDGLVATDVGFAPFVPDGESWWELSNDENPRRKASKDLTLRRSRLASQKASVTFVFATFRIWSEANQRTWKTRHSGAGFRDLRILDATQLADWLACWPAVAKWLLVIIGDVQHTAKLRCVAEHWQGLQRGKSSPDLEVPPQVFLIHRQQAADAIANLFAGSCNAVWLAVENGLDAQDFVAAVVASQDPATQRAWSSRCVFVDGAEEWMAMAGLRDRHVLVAGGQLDLAEREELRRAAEQAGHAIVVPTSSGAGSSQVFQLLPPPATEVDRVLSHAGWPRSTVRRLLGDGFSSMSVLKRRLAGEPDAPAYSNWPVRRELARACLVGGWNEGMEQDLAAVAEVLGQPFGHWRDAVICHITQPGTPVRLHDKTWRFVAHGEAWESFGATLVDADLRRFEAIALRVLSEPAPEFDLPKEERWMASILGTKRAHSTALRRGLAETLALLGSRARVLSVASHGLAETVSARVVRTLLHGADVVRWFALHDLLPVLAEAAPDTFLESVQSVLEVPSESPFGRLFAQEGGPIGGRTYTSGLLWALEALAWHPRYQARSIMLLAALASIDPGGRWMNRPANSLSTILLPWLPQTRAPLVARVEAIRQVAMRFEEVAWKLLVSLLPGERQSTSGSHRPTWRTELIEGWGEGVDSGSYIEQVEAYASLALDRASGNSIRVAELIPRCAKLPTAIRAKLLDHIVPALRDKSPADLRSVWEALMALSTRHRSALPNAPWVLPPEEVQAIERAAAIVAPHDPALEYVRFFDFHRPGRSSPDIREWQRREHEQRRNAVQEVLAKKGMAGIRLMLGAVQNWRLLGQTLGETQLDTENVDREILPQGVASNDSKEREFARSFVVARWQLRGWVWVDGLDTSTWTAQQRALLFANLPVTREGWERAAAQLGNDFPLYWQAIPPSPWMQEGTWLDAAEQLLEHGRPVTALHLCAIVSGEDVLRRVDLSLRALRASLDTPEPDAFNDPSNVQSLVQWLQEQQGVDQDTLSMIEWGYLGAIDHMHGVGPKTLDARLANDAAMFCEAVRLAYRSDKEAEDAGDVPTSPSQQHMAEAAYRLLDGMKALPGRGADGSFDGVAFGSWLANVQRLASETGHLAPAMSQVGRLIGRAAAAIDWLQKMPELAVALDAGWSDRLRTAFSIQIRNNRGVFSPTGGREEDALASRYDDDAIQAEGQGWFRIAAVLREIAEEYRRDAEQQRRDDRAQ